MAGEGDEARHCRNLSLEGTSRLRLVAKVVGAPGSSPVDPASTLGGLVAPTKGQNSVSWSPKHCASPMLIEERVQESAADAELDPERMRDRPGSSGQLEGVSGTWRRRGGCGGKRRRGERRGRSVGLAAFEFERCGRSCRERQGGDHFNFHAQ